MRQYTGNPERSNQYTGNFNIEKRPLTANELRKQRKSISWDANTYTLKKGGNR